MPEAEIAIDWCWCSRWNTFVNHVIMGPRASCMRLFLIILFLGICGLACGQEVMRGIVVDSASLDALPSVNIQIKNTTRGTTTDDKGNFSIVANRTDTLVFSSLGYLTLQLPLALYEPGMIRLSEKYTLLKAVTVNDYRRSENLYEGMFDEQNARREKTIPFFFSKAKKEKIKLGMLKEENLRVSTYLDVVVNNPELKTSLMAKYSLSEKEYYDILTAFNETHYQVMYYLTSAELISLLNRFFEARAPHR
jgi:hypothetical protein